jgi:hypothetical protein
MSKEPERIYSTTQLVEAWAAALTGLKDQLQVCPAAEALVLMAARWQHASAVR